MPADARPPLGNYQDSLQARLAAVLGARRAFIDARSAPSGSSARASSTSPRSASCSPGATAAERSNAAAERLGELTVDLAPRLMPSGDPGLALREATAKDEPFLRAMGWFASHWRDASSPPEQIRLPPQLSKYVDGFGRPGDCGLIAIWQGSPVGAAWYRLFEAPHGAYGYVGDDVAELSIAVLPGHRRRGIAGRLLERLLLEADTDCRSVEPQRRAGVIRHCACTSNPGIHQGWRKRRFVDDDQIEQSGETGRKRHSLHTTLRKPAPRARVGTGGMELGLRQAV